jgi:pimeloyl-ACP methyl ester carboxylesterase
VRSQRASTRHESHAGKQRCRVRRKDVDHRDAHTLPRHIRYQTALDFTRASSGIYNIVHTLPYLTSDLSRVQQPTLLLWGNRDQTLTPESFQRMENLLPNIVASHTMPVCGHVPHQCHPDQFNPHVMEFLKNITLKA